jgi:hypothetical protein
MSWALGVASRWRVQESFRKKRSPAAPRPALFVHSRSCCRRAQAWTPLGQWKQLRQGPGRDTGWVMPGPPGTGQQALGSWGTLAPPGHRGQHSSRTDPRPCFLGPLSGMGWEPQEAGHSLSCPITTSVLVTGMGCGSSLLPASALAGSNLHPQPRPITGNLSSARQSQGLEPSWLQTWSTWSSGQSGPPRGGRAQAVYTPGRIRAPVGHQPQTLARAGRP